ncbi:MAG: type IV pilus assembly protein PilC [Candidatus Omnitrophota bacterium]|jgi:type IV pilus assembly protein PilC
MPNFSYKARDKNGKLITGNMVAETRDELMQKLRGMDYMVSKISEGISNIDWRRINISFGSNGVKLPELVVAINQLSNLINAGIPILKSIQMLTKQSKNETLKKTFGDIDRKVQSGTSLSEAMNAHPKIFSNLLISMVRAGELSGNLDNILIKHAEYLEGQYDIQQKVRGALIYPAMLLGGGFLVTFYLITFVVPQFAQIFVKADVPLPLPTYILNVVGISIRQYWYVIMFVPLALVGGIGGAIKHKKTRPYWDKLKLKLPIWGQLECKLEVVKFTHTLGMLMVSGIPMLQALETTRKVLSNSVYRQIIAKVKMAVEGGATMCSVLRISREFPEETMQMIEVGEESGNVEHMLEKISNLNEKEVAQTLKNLMTLIEPLCLLIIGALVGLIMAAMLLPVLDMMKLLRK